MSENHTVALLREADSGTQMAVHSIKEILEKVQDQHLADILSASRQAHETLGNRIHAALSHFHESPKDPGMIAKGMSWMKTTAKTLMDDSDKTIADLITDGCNMGIKSMYQQLNRYADADDTSRQLTQELIRIEEDLRQQLRAYL